MGRVDFFFDYWLGVISFVVFATCPPHFLWEISGINFDDDDDLFQYVKFQFIFIFYSKLILLLHGKNKIIN